MTNDLVSSTNKLPKKKKKIEEEPVYLKRFKRLSPNFNTQSSLRTWYKKINFKNNKIIGKMWTLSG